MLFRSEPHGAESRVLKHDLGPRLRLSLGAGFGLGAVPLDIDFGLRFGLALGVPTRGLFGVHDG